MNHTDMVSACTRYYGLYFCYSDVRLILHVSLIFKYYYHVRSSRDTLEKDCRYCKHVCGKNVHTKQASYLRVTTTYFSRGTIPEPKYVYTRILTKDPYMYETY